ncbi:SPOR domain-containing protein [Mucilaginibacter sp. Bleaf8]|uniref:SPOR domain-containing protein n=1 Tax=Mucilaginibacter sp. Bleaf8 TaxID=2834430 RepID=UPI001BCCC6E1|nr:SPOR domain-containing protein [Mucilaginibacter sp. Bleaf8]MBS7566101.1 SPOR domain-containing protein [Mucilaginibacter sp. Bleaf8]
MNELKKTGLLISNKGVRLSAIAFLLAINFAAKAQTRGRLEIIKDPRLDSLIARRNSIGKSRGGRAGGGISAYGYRVQFFSGSGRKDAFNAQNKFQQLYPEIRTYITYREPNFKVKAGDFRTRLEAAKMMESLRGKFISMFILSEKINPPKLETNPQP